MITNTQRILYRDGYYPAYQQRTGKKVYNQGGLYNIESFEEAKTDKVWKIELENGMVSYFSDCTLFTDLMNYTHITDLKEGDNLIVVYPWFPFSNKFTLAREVLKAFVYGDGIKKICEIYKIKDLSKFKLLANKQEFISDFLCSLVKMYFKDFRYEWIIVKNTFSYEMLQEILLALSMFGIYAKIEKEKGKWVLFINSKDFLKNIGGPLGYSSKTQMIKKITPIDQDTQPFKVRVSVINNLVVNGIMVKGD
jgi:hypothetical protein